MDQMITLQFIFEKLDQQRASQSFSGHTLTKSVEDKDLAFRLVLEMDQQGFFEEACLAVVGVSGLNMRTLNAIYQAARHDETAVLRNGDRFQVDTVPSQEITHLCVVQNNNIFVYRTNTRTMEVSIL